MPAQATVREVGTRSKQKYAVEGNAAATNAQLNAALDAKLKMVAGETISASVSQKRNPLPATGGLGDSKDAVLLVKSAADELNKSRISVENMLTSYADPVKEGVILLPNADITDFITKYNTASGTDWIVYEGNYVG